MTFEMTRHEAADLARLVHKLRSRMPGDSWHVPGIEDALARARTRATAPDLAVAAIRAAMVPTNRTPAVIPLDGPHWREATDAPRPEQVPGHLRCSVCSEPKLRCESLWSADHAFAPSIPTRSIDVGRTVAEIRASLHPTREDPS